jgi:AcrR family transcriptional regulator
MARPQKGEKPDLREAVKEAAWEQIAERGAAALSLRAVARQLQITAPAIYNYYNRRDDLVTALIVDAYTSLGDWQFAALEDRPERDHAGRLRVLGMAYREWAVTFPQRYQLIFGTPIPHYHASPEATMPAASRSLSALIGELENARKAGNLRVDQHPRLEASLAEQFRDWQRLHPASSVYALYLALVIWSRVHGLVSLEISHQYPAFIEDTGEIFRREVEMLVLDYLE